MGADSKKPEAERRNYKNVVDAITRIGKEEGVAALWSGAGPTIARACLLNAGQLGVYSEAKEVLSASAGLSGIPLQFIGSLIASVAANSTIPRVYLAVSRKTLGPVSRPASSCRVGLAVFSDRGSRALQC
jgi:solute carrier family 25 oxoglutarate transporter 11